MAYVCNTAIVLSLESRNDIRNLAHNWYISIVLSRLLIIDVNSRHVELGTGFIWIGLLNFNLQLCQTAIPVADSGSYVADS